MTVQTMHILAADDGYGKLIGIGVVIAVWIWGFLASQMNKKKKAQSQGGQAEPQSEPWQVILRQLTAGPMEKAAIAAQSATPPPLPPARKKVAKRKKAAAPVMAAAPPVAASPPAELPPTMATRPAPTKMNVPQFSPGNLKRAVVLAEIFGKPKALRDD